MIPHTTFTKVARLVRAGSTSLVIPTDGATRAEAQDEVIAALRAPPRTPARPGEQLRAW